MRRVLPLVGLGALLLLSACNHTRWPTLNRNVPEPPPPANTPTPTVAMLVQYLNLNAERIKTLRCENMELTCTVTPGALPRTFGLTGDMIVQQPKNFRMAAKAFGKDEVDLGSNDEEFWYWIPKAENVQAHCSYKDLAAGTVKIMPFPFQPNWVMEALGMADFGPPERWQLQAEGDKLKLIEHTRSPQGKAVSKVIVFRRQKAEPPTPQVSDFLLVDDASNQVICSAHVSASQLLSQTNGLLPRQLELSWPAQKMKLAMRLNHATTNIDIQPNSPAFVRRPLSNVPSFDLATGRPDGQPSSLQRASLIR